MTEREKMYGGMIFDSHDPELAAELKRSRRLCDRYNALSVDDEEERLAILKELFGTEDFGDFRAMERPMYIDNGRDITIGKNFYSNIYFHFSGGNRVTIGDNVMIGPCCTLATGFHSLVAEERRMQTDERGGTHSYEYGGPIHIGNDVWIAAHVTICGGVTIGDGSVIGAGSVVTRDIPDWSFAAGNPCRVIRKITEADRKYYFKDRELDEEVDAELRAKLEGIR